jgi:hypothetical protein
MKKRRPSGTSPPTPAKHPKHSRQARGERAQGLQDGLLVLPDRTALHRDLRDGLHVWGRTKKDLVEARHAAAAVAKLFKDRHAQEALRAVQAPHGATNSRTRSADEGESFRAGGQKVQCQGGGSQPHWFRAEDLIHPRERGQHGLVATLDDRDNGVGAADLRPMPAGLAAVAGTAQDKLRSAKGPAWEAMRGAVKFAGVDGRLAFAMVAVHQEMELDGAPALKCTIFEPHADRPVGRVVTMYALCGDSFIMVNVPRHHLRGVREGRDTAKYEAWKAEAFPGGAVDAAVLDLEKAVEEGSSCVGKEGGRRRVVALEAGEKVTFTASRMTHGTVVPVAAGVRRTLAIFHALDAR